MNRRDVLRGMVGAGTAAMAGCSVVAPECGPTETPLGDLADRVHDGADPGQVTVRGIVARPVGPDMTISDGTGVANLNAPGLKSFNPDWFSEGECVEATASVMGDFSREYAVLNLDVQSGEDVETVGFGEPKRDPPELPEDPDVSLAIDYAEDGVRLTHEGSASVPAKRLEIRHLRNDRDDLTTYPWHELTDADPDTAVEPGAALTFRKSGEGHAVWRHSEHWARLISSGWEL